MRFVVDERKGKEPIVFKKYEAVRRSSAAWSSAALALSMLLSSLGTSIANVALPTLAHVFAASLQQVQWIVIAYLLAITSVIVSVGRLADIVGYRRVLLSGISIFTAASLLCAVAPTLWVLISARAIQGLGAATMMALSIAFIGRLLPTSKTGSAMGLLGSTSAIGTALGPALGGALTGALGWPAIFFAIALLGAITLIIVYLRVPADAVAAEHRVAFDKVGTLVLTLTLAAYALAMTMGRGSFQFLNLSLLAFAMLGVVLFIFVEARVAAPLVRLSLLRDQVLSTGLVTSVLVSTVMMTTLVVGPFYLSGGLGLGPTAVGMALSIGPAVAALAGLPAGHLSDRVGADRAGIAGLSGMAAGSFALAMMPMALGLIGYIAPMVVLTLGYAIFQTANNTLVMKEVQAHHRGLISGMLNLARNLGLVTGASVMGAVFAFGSGTSEIRLARPESVATGMHLAFGASGTLILIALVVAIRSGALIKRRARLLPGQVSV